MSQKYKTLIGSLLILLVLGSVYAWSLFNRPLADKYQVSLSEVALTFGVMSLAIAVGASFVGQLKVKIGIINVIMLAASLIGAGLGLAAFVPNTITLYFTAGVLLGLGDGMGYMLVLTNCVRFFPRSKGVISALAIGAYGGGSLIFKFIDSMMMQSYGIEVALLVWAVITCSVIAFATMLVYDSIGTVVKTSASNVRDLELSESIKTKEYWLLSAMFFIDCMCGLYVIGVVSDIGSTFLNLNYEDAATAVSVVALANIAGRIIMGALSDKLPRIRLITFDQVLSFIAMAMLLLISRNAITFYIAIALIAFSFGGTLTIYPSIISDFFGLRNFAKNYGLLYLGFGIGSLTGSVIAVLLGSFTITFIIISLLLIVAIVLSLMIKLPDDLKKAHTTLVKENLIKVHSTNVNEVRGSDGLEIKSEGKTETDAYTKVETVATDKLSAKENTESSKAPIKDAESKEDTRSRAKTDAFVKAKALDDVFTKKDSEVKTKIESLSQVLNEAEALDKAKNSVSDNTDKSDADTTQNKIDEFTKATTQAMHIDIDEMIATAKSKDYKGTDKSEDTKVLPKATTKDTLSLTQDVFATDVLAKKSGDASQDTSLDTDNRAKESVSYIEEQTEDSGTQVDATEVKAEDELRGLEDTELDPKSKSFPFFSFWHKKRREKEVSQKRNDYAVDEHELHALEKEDYGYESSHFCKTNKMPSLDGENASVESESDSGIKATKEAEPPLDYLKDYAGVPPQKEVNLPRK